MKALTLPLALYTTLSSVTFSASIVQNNSADDQKWFSDQTGAGDTGTGPYGTLAANSSLVSSGFPTARQNFDERSLTFTDLSGTIVDELFIVVDVVPSSGTPVFDDGFAIDLNSDNVIDYAFTQRDALATPGIDGSYSIYNPWTDASPLTLEMTITTTGTSIDLFWKGIQITPGSSTTSPIGFDNTSSFTLENLGFNADGSVPSDDFTMQAMRIGPINTEGGSASANTDFNFDGITLRDDLGNVTTYDPDGDGLPSGIPEPSSSILLGLSALSLMRRKRA